MKPGDRGPQLAVLHSKTYIGAMHVVTYTDARARLKEVLDKVSTDRAPVLISRQKGEPAVLISLSEWNGMQETLHLMSNPRNAARLLEGIREFDAGLGQERDLIQP